MLATWSDSDTNYSDDSEDQVVNLGLMAREEQAQEEATKCESSNEVDYSVFLEYSEDEFAQALVNCVECEQKYLFKVKSLNNAIRDSTFEKKALQKSSDELHIKIDTLETKKQDVQSKCEGFEKLVLKFSKGQENLEKLLGSKRMSFNKEGIGYCIIPLTKRRAIRTLFNERSETNLILNAIIA